jgi:hypothetical protein
MSGSTGSLQTDLRKVFQIPPDLKARHVRECLGAARRQDRVADLAKSTI